MQITDPSSGVRTNEFRFNFAWASGRSVVVEACSDLVNSVWFPVATNTITDGVSYFSDPQWTNYSARLYRIRWP